MPSPYTKTLLLEILKEGGATVLEEYTKTPQRLHVRFRCSCGVETSKRFEMLKMYRLAYCQSCSLKEAEKRKQSTNMERYGVTNIAAHPDVVKKIKETFASKYGGHPKQTEQVQEKWLATCLEKYGGHPNQNRDVQVKAEYKGCHYKDYILPSGKFIKVQGFEHLALDLLLKTMQEDQIIVGKANVPTIEYFIGDKRHVYFPDIYLPAEHKLIEVKSEWTLLKPTHPEEKAEASVAEGYAYEVWVFTGNKKFSRKIVYAFDGSCETFLAGS